MNILRLLNIKQSEARPILMLIAYSFFMGLSIAFYFTATISDFLTNFDITILPYTYILSGILGYLLWLVWSYLEKKVAFTKRLMLGITFLVITVSLQGIGIVYFYEVWLSFVMLVWVRVFIFVNMVNFWGMAGKLFNLSQGKRLFGIISIGSVISDIFGFFSIPFILLLGIQNQGLILIALLALVICLLITFQITRIFKEQLKETVSNPILKEASDTKEPFFKSKYHLYLFSLAILPMFGFYFVDYLFLDQIQNEYQHSAEALAGFMGIFFGVVAVFELIIKTTVFSRLIYNFGLKVTLLVLPGILLGTVILTITTGLVAGSFGFLFSMIAFIKLLEKILRSGVNDPSFQILYQPIPSQERLSFQSKMEGIPTALGNILAGVLLLILIFFDFTNPILFNSIFLIVLILWCYMAYGMQKEYREVIVNNLADLNKENSESSLGSHIQMSSLLDFHEDKADHEVIRSLHLIQNLNIGDFKASLKKLIAHPSSEVQKVVLKSIQKNKLTEYLPILKQKIETKNSNSNNIDLLEETIDELNQFRNMVVDSIKKVNLSDDVVTKLKKLEMLDTSDDLQGRKQLIEDLIMDDDQAVASKALNLIPKPLNASYANMIIQSLENMTYSHLAIPILNERNPIVEGLLIKKLQQIESAQWSDLNSQLLSLQIIRLLANTGSTEAQQFMIKLLEFSNSEIKYFTAAALDKSNYRAMDDEKVIFVQMIEKEVAFCTWLLACKQDLYGIKKDTSVLFKCLHVEYLRSTEKIFAFLSFIYSRVTVQQIKTNLRSESTDKNVLGIEMCEMLLSDTLKSMLIPIFSNIPDAERLKFLNKEFPQQNFTLIRRLENIVYHNFTKVNTWLKILATDIISKKNNDIVPKEIFANLHIKNPTIKESSYLAIHKINKEEFDNRIKSEHPDYQLHFDKLTGIDPVLGKKDSVFESVNKLKNFLLFKDVYEIELIKLAARMLKIDLSGPDFFCDEYSNSNYIHFVYRGSITLMISSEKITFEKGDIIGLFEAHNLQDSKFEAEEETQILAIEAQYFFKIVSIYDDLAQAILDHYLNSQFTDDQSISSENILLEAV